MSNLVSVIVMCHKQSQYLAECLDSLWAQSYLDVEVLVACGDDESLRVAQDYFHSHLIGLGSWKIDGRSSAFILPGLVHGRADAFNTAAQTSKGEYLLRLDADDTLVPTAIEKFVAEAKRLKEQGAADVIVTSHFKEFGQGERLFVLGDYSPQAMLLGNYIHCSSLFSRTLWEKTGGYEQALFGHEDWEFWIHCTKYSPTVGKVHEVLMNYRIHSESSSEFCYRHDNVLRAAIRLLHSDLYEGQQNVTGDLFTVVRCPEEVADEFRKRASWFPGNANVMWFADLLDPKVRSALGAGG